MTYDIGQAIQEAINAGENALISLKDAQSYLNSARTWGLIDIFGGKFITNLIKHSKINGARQSIERARQDLRRFQKELENVDDYLPNIGVGDFTAFADFFFDGIIADVFVQYKISEAREQVFNAMYQVESIINRLKHEQGQFAP